MLRDFPPRPSGRMQTKSRILALLVLTAAGMLSVSDAGATGETLLHVSPDGNGSQGVNPNLSCSNPDVARQVSLSISWPDAP